MSMVDLLKKTKLYAWYHQKHIKRIKELEAIRSKFFLEEGEDLLKRFTLVTYDECQGVLSEFSKK